MADSQDNDRPDVTDAEKIRRRLFENQDSDNSGASLAGDEEVALQNIHMGSRQASRDRAGVESNASLPNQNDSSVESAATIACRRAIRCSG